MQIAAQSYHPRPHYERVLEETLETPSIKVLTGLRRCGKSTLLTMLADAVIGKGVPQRNCLRLKLDSYEVPLEPTASWLDELLKHRLEESEPSAPFYVFLDEIQEVKGWERPVRRLHTDSRAHIFLTGSNAFLLSSDLATYLSGRYTEIHVYPLSFKEYLSFHEFFEGRVSEESDSETVFERYLRFGGMPGLFQSTDFTEQSVTRELTAIHDTVLLNDVAKRFGIRDIDLLEKLLRYTYATSGNLFSPNKVAGALTGMGRKTNAETVDSYLESLKRAFALHECQQEGLKGKSLLQPKRKYYAPDTGMRNLESGFSMQDIGFQLENCVFCELIRRGFEVHVGTLPIGEIDFVGQRGSERVYIQVCETLVDEKTRMRETAPLDALGDSFPKYILTRDRAAVGTTATGVRIVLVQDWLLEGG